MLTKEKIISAIQAMPEDEFEDIEVVVEKLVSAAEEEQLKNARTENKDGNTGVFEEPLADYQSGTINNYGAKDEDIAEMISHIDNKIENATDLETIYLLKKIKSGLQNSMEGNYFTIEEVQAKIDSWFKK